MFTVSHMSYCGFQFDGKIDIDRRDVELLLQQRNQALRPGVDYMFQPMATSWQVSGITPMGARAVATIAQSHKFIPNRIDVTCEIHDNVISEATDYQTIVGKLEAWFKVHKPRLNVTPMLPLGGDRKILFGSRNSRWCLWVAEKTDPVKPFGGFVLSLEWALRNENCLAVWEYYVSCNDDFAWEAQSQEAFDAATNSILGPDFFGLGHSGMPYLKREKPTSDKKDWYSYLSGVAQKIVKNTIDDPNGSVERDMLFLTREIERLVTKIEKSVV